nr:hypothetical protein BV87_21285 [Sphingobium yanoikuyae]
MRQLPGIYFPAFEITPRRFLISQQPLNQFGCRDAVGIAYTGADIGQQLNTGRGTLIRLRRHDSIHSSLPSQLRPLTAC